jgi:hypothetical protein
MIQQDIENIVITLYLVVCFVNLHVSRKYLKKYKLINIKSPGPDGIEPKIVKDV